VSVVLRRTVCGDTREFKKIATAGANTAAGSKFLKKCHVRRLRPAVAYSGGFAVVATTSGLFRFSDLFLRMSQHLKSSNGEYIL